MKISDEYKNIKLREHLFESHGMVPTSAFYKDIEYLVGWHERDHTSMPSHNHDTE